MAVYDPAKVLFADFNAFGKLSLSYLARNKIMLPQDLAGVSGFAVPAQGGAIRHRSETDSTRTVNSSQGWNSRYIHITGGVPCIIGTLHSNPQQRLGAE